MLMIPLPFVIALFAGIFLLRELLNAENGQRNPWFAAFFSLFVFQEMLIGLRFGYGLDGLRLVQPFSASLIPGLAYLGFRRPRWDPILAVHLLPLLAVVVTLFMLHDILDVVLAATNIFYAVALIRLGLRGSDALGWVEIHRTKAVLMLLWFVSGVLIVSGITDAAIVYDFMKTSGANTASIAGWATAAGLVLTAAGFAVFRLLSTKNRQADAHNPDVFEKLNALMHQEKLHLDPDINLNRIARRMVLPAREVSRAVNGSTGANVSQYINKLRIEEACRLLKDTEIPVTQIVFAAGFNIKSNFNREFSRNIGQSPREWRQAQTVKR